MKNNIEVPWDIRMISALFVFIGTFGTAYAVFTWIHGSGELTFAFLLIFLGIGLCKRYRSAKTWSQIVAGLCVLLGSGVAIGFLIGTLPPFRFRIGQKVIPVTGFPFHLVIALLVFVFGIWIFWSTSRFFSLSFTTSELESAEEADDASSDEIERSKPAHQSSAFEPLSESCKVYLWSGAVAGIMISALVFVVGLMAPEPVDEQRTQMLKRKKHQMIVNRVYYGERFGKLAYVVFLRGLPRESAEEIFEERIRNGTRWKMINVSGKRTISLPGSHLIYEIQNGRIQTADLSLTSEQLKSYLDSNPEEYSIQSLRNFLRGIEK